LFAGIIGVYVSIFSEFEASFLRLLDKLTNGSIIEINASGKKYQETFWLINVGFLWTILMLVEWWMQSQRLIQKIFATTKTVRSISHKS